jgi:hypothetical protein
MSATSSVTASAATCSPRNADRSSKPSKPRKRYHGSAAISSGLTPDRLKPQTSAASKPDTAGTTPRPPPGLSSETEAGPATDTKAEDEDPEGELCFICGNSMKGRYYSVAPCNNAFCHNCSLRLRALYKSTNCPFCKVLI